MCIRDRGRPRSEIQLSRQVHYRITEDEYLTIETLAGAWAERLRAQGVPLTGDNRNAWFRSTLGEARKHAEAQGVVFPEAPPVDPAPLVDPALPVDACTPHVSSWASSWPAR